MKVVTVILTILCGYQLLATSRVVGTKTTYKVGRTVEFLSTGESRLVQAIIDGKSPIQIRKLTEGLLDVNFVVANFESEKDGQEIVVSGTPLSIAAGLGAEETVEALLEIDSIEVDILVMTGNDPRTKGWQKLARIQTALGTAVDGSHLGVIKLLVEKGGADVTIGKMMIISPYEIDASVDRHQLSWTSQLIVATELEDSETVSYLLDNGANPNETTTYTNLAPINVTAVTGNIEIAKTLIEHGANVDNWAVGVEFTSDGRIISGGKGIHGTPLGVAAYKNDQDMVELLLASKADPNYEMFGWGPMDSAILKENWGIVDILSKAGGKQRELSL